jgi:hypothetical protein
MSTLSGTRIRHGVAFTLTHPRGSDAERGFLAALSALRSIAGVEAFEVLEEVSPKNGYQLGVSMEFADRGAYDAYTSDPRHVSFVEGRWVPEVRDFLEIDFAVAS